MTKRIILLTLLIHRYTQDKYYRKHDLFVEKQKKWLEAIRQSPFDALPIDRQTYYLDSWFWPPWRFNNIVGFAEVEFETELTVIGHLYLPEGRASRAVKKPLYLNYACASADFERDNLQSLQKAIIETVEQLQSIVEERKWKLEFDEEYVHHTDFLAMIRVREHNYIEGD